MMTKISVDASGLQRMLERMNRFPERLVEKFKEEAGDLVQGEMVRRAPFDRGFLSMLILVDDTQPNAVFVESTASYTKWVVAGTGIHGPRGRPIVPVRAKALKFKIGGRTVFARSVRGSPPNPFIKDTAKAVTPMLQALVQRLISEEMVADVI